MTPTRRRPPPARRRRAGRPRKAVLLGAGLGTRMRPLSYDLPKPIMPVHGVPTIERMVRMLVGWGVEEFLVNLHHNPPMLFLYLRDLALREGIRIAMSFEPELLDTGGVLRRARWFLDDRPFWIANTDILAELDPAPLLDRFAARRPLAALWVTDMGGPRTVAVAGGVVTDFRSGNAGSTGTVTFCGLHLVSPDILGVLPEEACPFSIIKAYENAMRAGDTVAAVTVPASRWQDLGAPASYLAAHPRGWQAPDAHRCRGSVCTGSVLWSGARLGPSARIHGAIVGRGVYIDRPATGVLIRGNGLPPDHALRLAMADLHWPADEVVLNALPPRGSDRRFARLIRGETSVMTVTHGTARPENDAYAAHARFLRRRGIPVPRVLREYPRHRLLVLEDAGDRSLEHAVPGWQRPTVIRRYRRVLDSVLALHTIPGRSACRRRLEPPFDAALYRWEHALLDAHLLEPRAAFPPKRRRTIRHELERVAAHLATSPRGLVHRDMQSSNVLVLPRGHRIIDFQGMRWGPVAYDVASLLADPYVMLPDGVQARLLAYYAERHPLGTAVADTFWWAAVQRLAQALGAFGRLAALPGMARFADYIGPAGSMLTRALDHLPPLPALQTMARDL